ncbi:MAG TPA: glycosyltransferase [Chloroflexia bacterium]|nr:glycosyltransferase [Chloroflexia bacterium]
MDKLTIAITTKNKYSLTRYCLESISLTLPPDAYEILIVDNGSNDETLELANFHRFVSNTAGGLYESWNIAVRETRTDYVAILQNDVYFCTPDWWHWFRLAATQTDAQWLYPVLVESQQIVPRTYDIAKAAAGKSDLDFAYRYGTIDSPCFVIPRSLFDVVGPFDSRFDIWYGTEDYEIRMIEAGIRHGQVRNVVVRHFGHSTLVVNSRETRPYGLKSGMEPAVVERAKRDYELFRTKYPLGPAKPGGTEL